MSSPANTTVPPYFVSLGAGAHQTALIRAARAQGYRVIAVDRNLAAPGMKEADLHLQCSIVRPKKIKLLIAEHLLEGRVVGIGCRSFGRATCSAALLADHFGTPGLTLDTLKHFRNKRESKDFLSRHGILTPAIHRWRNQTEKKALLKAKPPVIVRPANGHAKLGLEFLNDAVEIENFIEEAGPDTGELLVEEFVSGKEVTVLGFVHNGVFHSMLVTEKEISPRPPYCAELKHRFPAGLSHAERETLSIYMQRIATATGMRVGPLVAEFIFPDEEQNRAYLVECYPEIGGEYLADIVIPHAYGGWDYFQNLVRLVSGKTPFIDDVPPPRPENAVIVRFLPPKDGTFRSLEFPKMRKDDSLIFQRVLKQPGDRTSTERGNLDRLAVFALCAPIDRVDALNERVDEIAGDTKIVYD